MDIPWQPSDEMATWRTMDDAAKQLRVSRRTITRWVSEGHIHAWTRPGDRKRYVDLDEIRKYREQYRPVELKREGMQHGETDGQGRPDP